MPPRLTVDVAEPAQLGRIAAEHLASMLRQAARVRDTCAVAFSGGSTPRAMFAALRTMELPWSRVHVFQADERIAPEDHPDRNLTVLRRDLLDHVPIPSAQVHPMPAGSSDPVTAAQDYEEELRRVCGEPSILDVVHLGLGEDGHAASLVPGDPVLGMDDRDVAVTRPYQGRRRLTLTYPVLNRSGRILWLVSGANKAAVLRQLLDGEPSIPASSIRRSRALVVADVGAATLIT